MKMTNHTYIKLIPKIDFYPLHFKQYHTGRLLTAAWGVVTIFLIMFYSSNLRQQLVAPRYEPEVNNEQDILDQRYNKIYTWNGDNEISILYQPVMLRFPKHYEM